MMETNYSNGFERDEKILSKNDLDHRKWTNPLEIKFVLILLIYGTPGILNLIRLPNSPSMKIYCIYGHGKETEVSMRI